MKKKEKLKVSGTEEMKISETTASEKVDLQNPAFDPDIPEQKQRHFR